MQPSVPSARNVRGGVIVRVRGHHPPVSSLLRRDVLVIFVSERVLADEFALTSLEVPARDASAAVLVSRAVLSLSLRSRTTKARARTHHTLPSNILVLRRRTRGSKVRNVRFARLPAFEFAIERVRAIERDRVDGIDVARERTAWTRVARGRSTARHFGKPSSPRSSFASSRARVA